MTLSREVYTLELQCFTGSLMSDSPLFSSRLMYFVTFMRPLLLGLCWCLLIPVPEHSGSLASCGIIYSSGAGLMLSRG